MKNGTRVAKVIEQVPFSGTRKFFDIAAQMENVISLSVGEPDFPTPVKVQEAAIESIRAGKTKYTTNAGLLELRREVCNYIERRNGLSYDPVKQVLVTVGASEGVLTSMQALVDPGDEVLVVDPGYVSYKPSVALAGGIPVVIETKAENDFKLQPDELLAKITGKTKVLLINYPANPTGAIMEREDLEKIAAVLRERDIIVISDEIYSELTYNDRKHASIAELPGMYDKTVILNGFSKTYSMTGWRLAYACGPADIIEAMLKIHQYAAMSATTTSQYAGIAALRHCDEDIERMRNEYNERRQLMLRGLRDIGMSCFEPLGAFYMFPSIAKTGLKSDEFCERLLYENKVSVVSGAPFGSCGEGFVRCSYAYSTESIKTALDRIEKFLSKL